MDPLNAANLNSGTVAAARGGAGTVNGVLQANGSGTVSAATLSGNGTTLASTTGAQTSGRCVQIDANGNHVAAAGACGSSSGIASAFAAIGWVAGVDPNKTVILTASTGDDRHRHPRHRRRCNRLGRHRRCQQGAFGHRLSGRARSSTRARSTPTAPPRPTRPSPWLAVGRTASTGDRLCLVTTGGANWTGGAGNGGVTVTYTVP